MRFHYVTLFRTKESEPNGIKRLSITGNVINIKQKSEGECKFKLKAGVHMKAVFWLGIMFFMQISCLRFKQSRIPLLISHIYVLGCFGNILVIFRYIWREIVFLKGLVKLMEIGNFEDLLLF